jgi:kynurenine formamidase
VKSLLGTTDKAKWPASPAITVEHIKQYEAQHSGLKAGEIVIFQTGHSDKHFKPFPAGEACLGDPLNGKSEGWPAPDAAAIVHLAERGIRCVATDAPSLGSVDPQQALMTYWTLGTHGMSGVEYLTGVGQLKGKAFFLFAPVKIRDCHGGPGRAIAVLM